MRTLFQFLLGSALVLGSAAAHAQSIVYVRTSCAGAPTPCRTSISSVLSDLDASVFSEPLVIEVGPGTFGAFNRTCPSGTGKISVRGSGPAQTRLSGSYPVVAANCVGLDLRSLKIEGAFGISWTGAGGSTSSNVDIVASVAALLDGSCAGSETDPPLSTHRFFGSHVRGGSFGLVDYCGAVTLFGSDLEIRPTSTVAEAIGVQVGHRGSVEIYGGSLRVSAAGLSPTAATDLVGVRVGPDSGSFEMHGGIIRTDAGNLTGSSGGDVVGIEVQNGSTGTARANTAETAFVGFPGAAGSYARVVGGGKAEAPFLWAAGETPPSVESEQGQDLFVETDCAAAGSCGSAGSEPHLMIYRADCAGNGGPWFDVVTGACRAP